MWNRSEIRIERHISHFKSELKELLSAVYNRNYIRKQHADFNQVVIRIVNRTEIDLHVLIGCHDKDNISKVEFEPTVYVVARSFSRNFNNKFFLR